MYAINDQNICLAEFFIVLQNRTEVIPKNRSIQIHCLQVLSDGVFKVLCNARGVVYSFVALSPYYRAANYLKAAWRIPI